MLDGRRVPSVRPLARRYRPSSSIILWWQTCCCRRLDFIVLYRIPFDAVRSWRRERCAVYLTNIALAGVIGGLGLMLGYRDVVAVQLPTMICASIVGVWLFSVQHRFESALWSPEGSWDFGAASLKSTSHLHLPRILQ